MTTKDVHTENCCVVHGCRWGHKNCTVANGTKRQSKECSRHASISKQVTRAIAEALAGAAK